MFFSDGKVISGEWIDGEFSDEGVMTWKQKKEENNVRDVTKLNIYHQSELIFNEISDGIEHQFQNCKYEGSFKNYSRDGIGNFTFSNTCTYHGSWSKDKKHGTGLISWINGHEYSGSFVEDRMHGYGTYTFEMKRDQTSYSVNDIIGLISMINGKMIKVTYGKIAF